MNYNVELTDNFKKEAKRLAKKYKSLKTDIAKLITELETNPTKGISLGNNIYKIRLAIASKGKGKSGGARIMSYVKLPKQKYYYSLSTIKAKKILSLIRKLKIL